jgi:Glycosyltransferase family 87
MAVRSAARPAPRLPAWVLPLAALAVLSVALLVVLATAGSTLGYDFQAYVSAAHRALDGQPLYDPSVDVAGGFAIFLYPPPFALALIPFALLPADLALPLWTALLVAAFLLGTWWLPVRLEVRWLVVLLGGLMWPLLYSIKLGQVGPLLYLAFAAGWRWMDVPWRLGAAVAAGTLVKVQPVLLIGWAAATRRFGAVAWAIGLLLSAALVSTLVFGPSVWGDYLTLLARVSSPVTTPHDFTVGAVLYQLGVPESAATMAQWAAVATTVVVTVWSWFRAPAVVGYLVTVVASQLVSPLLWDHYAMLLLLPVAWLLERRQRWAALIPLALALPVVWITPPIAYPVCFAVMLVAPVIVAARSSGRQELRLEATG